MASPRLLLRLKPVYRSLINQSSTNINCSVYDNNVCLQSDCRKRILDIREEIVQEVTMRVEARIMRILKAFQCNFPIVQCSYFCRYGDEESTRWTREDERQLYHSAGIF